MNELEKIQAEMAFYAEVGPVMEELEAARAVKKEDPERWRKAVAAVDGYSGPDGEEVIGLRTAYRLLAQESFVPTIEEDGNAEIKVDSTNIDTDIIAPGGK